MKRFAALLDRLAYESGRNAKLRLLADYFASAPDPDRGFALAALTGALSFRHAKPGIIRALIAERSDPVLFAMAYDYVGDLSETVALMWPSSPKQSASAPSLACGGGRGGGSPALMGLPTSPLPDPPPQAGEGKEPAPSLTTVVTTLASLGKAALPGQLARWLDQLDETGRWALLKLVTGELRIGVSARLAKTAVAATGGKDVHELELIWSGLRPPYVELFAWLEGRADKPLSNDPAPFRPAMLAHALEASELAELDPRDFIGEWKWDGIRVQAVCGLDAQGELVARLYSRTGEDISPGFP